MSRLNHTESIKVEAFDIATDESCGVFESASQAARKLFIRCSSSITNQVFGGHGSTHKGKKRGLKNYKNDIKYYFKIVS